MRSAIELKTSFAFMLDTGELCLHYIFPYETEPRTSTSCYRVTNGPKLSTDLILMLNVPMLASLKKYEADRRAAAR